MTTRPPSGELAEALRRAGLESLEPVFAAHDVDDRVLRDLTDADLRDLGLTLGQRKRLLAEVAGLDAPGARGPAGDGAFEMRRMSVLFCDLVESTELARRLSPDDLYDVLQSYYQTAGEVARRFRGGIASLQGDGIVALFGYPEATGADAEMAIGAGLALLDELRARRHRLSDGRLVAIEARVGIASGASAIGRSRLGFMVAEEIHAVGPTPNLAARLQSRAEPGWVVVDDRTRELTRDLFEFEPRPPADLKGFEGPVGVWRALRRRGGADRFTALRRSERPLVGREAELAALSALWAQARTGRGRLLRVVGEAGQGKSRLLARLEADAAAEGARTVRLDCSPLSAHAPLQPVIDRIESVVGRAGDRPPALRLAALRRAMPGADADAVGQVAALLSIEGAGGPVPSGPEARAALFAALGGLLLGDGARPALIVLEDAHWADPTTLDLLDALAARISTVPALLAAATRGGAAIWPGRADVVELALAPLDAAAAEALIGDLGAGRMLSDETRAAILSRSDGNPLLLEELAEGAHRPGAADPRFERSAPASLYDSVAERIDRLREGRAVAGAAAVFGRAAPTPALALVLGMSDAALDAALAGLRAAGVFDPVRPGAADEARFRHGLVREVLYESLPAARRRALHRAAARALRAATPELAERRPDLIAWHSFEAGRYEDAAPSHILAGRRAAERSALIEATHHLERALSALDALPLDPSTERRRLEALTSLTAVKRARLGIAAPEVGRLSEELRNLARRLGDRDAELLALNGLYACSLVGADFRGAARWGAELLDAARRAGDETFEMIGLRASGVVAFYRGALGRAETELRDALSRYDRDRHRRLAETFGYDHAAITGAFLAFVLWARGDIAGAWAVSDRALRHAESLGHQHTLGQALVFRAMLGMLGRDRAPTLDSGARTIEVGQRHSLALMEAGGAYFHAVGRSFGMTPDEAAATAPEFREAAARLATVMPDNHGPLIRLFSAGRMALAGDLGAAAAQLDAAEEIQRRTGEVWSEPELLRARALLTEAAGDGPAARAGLRAALALAEARGAAGFALRIACDLAERTRDPAAARALLDGAEARMISLGDGWDARRLAALRARIGGRGASA